MQIVLKQHVSSNCIKTLVITFILNNEFTSSLALVKIAPMSSFGFHLLGKPFSSILKTLSNLDFFFFQC